MAVKILGHRGINQLENKILPYQNTMEAFNYAIEKGADGFELDVILSKDEKCFIIHDDDISKHNAGTGFINQLDSKDIKTKKLSEKYNIPSLLDILDAFSKKNKLINIEIKQHGIAEYVMNEIASSNYPIENILLSSFNHHDLITARNLNKNIKIGLLFGRESRNDKNFEQYIMQLSEKLAPTALCMEKTLSYLSVLESSNEKYFWTIKKEDIDNYLVQGLQMYENANFITDYPAELAKAIKS